MLTKAELTTQVEATLSVYRQWQMSPDRSVTPDLAESLNALFAVCDTMDAADDCREAVLAVDSLEAAAKEWQRVRERNLHDRSYDAGTRKMWGNLESLPDCFASRVPMGIESPERLSKVEKVPDFQIAKMMGWRRPDGRPDVAKVREELESPGTHFDPSSSVNPEHARHERKIAEQWEARTKKKQQAAEEAEAPPPPEPLEQLVILPGITCKQIRKIHPGASDGDIHAAAQRMMGRTLPELVHYEVGPTNVAEAEAQQQEEFEQRQRDHQRLRSVDVPEGDLSDQIMALWRDGYHAGEIADILGREHPGLTAVAVGQIIGQLDGKADAEPTIETQDETIVRLAGEGMRAGEIAERLGGRDEGWSAQKVGRRLKSLEQLA